MKKLLLIIAIFASSQLFAQTNDSLQKEINKINLHLENQSRLSRSSDASFVFGTLSTVIGAIVIKNNYGAGLGLISVGTGSLIISRLKITSALKFKK